MQEKSKVWDLPVRVFHWGLAASFAGAYVLSESERLRNVHVALGYTALALIAFRILWGFVGSRYARFTSFAYGPVAALRYLRDAVSGRAQHYTGHNPAGSWAVYGILLLGLATGLTGYMQYEGLGGESLEELHEVMANAWLVLVGLHVIGVMFSSLAHRENLALAMITGRKRGEDGVAYPRAVRGVGLGLAAALAGFWGWSLLGGGLPANAGAGLDGAADAEQPGLAAQSEKDDD
jgi:cytochrome b